MAKCQKFTHFVGEYHQDWDQWLPEFHLAINTAVHEMTNVTPAVLALGSNIKDPLERFIYKSPAPGTSAYHTIDSNSKFLQDVERHVGLAKARQARYYTTKHKDVSYTLLLVI